MAAEGNGTLRPDATRERLLALLSDGGWHSGDRLAGALGVSRTAVWKSVRRLSERGVQVERARGRGYRLACPLDPVDPSRLGLFWRALAGPSARTEVHEVVGSTNDIAVADRGEAPLLVAAEYQSGGRGRRGRRWWSPYGAGLCFSLARILGPVAGGLGALPLACALGVVDGLESLCGGPFGIKWPNDIEWQGRKLGGILVEIQGESAGPFWTVVGVGLNVHRPGAAWPPEVEARLAVLDDLCPETPWRRDDVLQALVEGLWRRLETFARAGFVSMEEDYARHDVLNGRTVVVQREGESPLSGTARGIDASGWLRLATPAGEVRVGVGEASVRAT
jgi:BirA family biotin operon repressor/biotin-[acetyl-CoA-carboxylase] ligase